TLSPWSGIASQRRGGHAACRKSAYPCFGGSSDSARNGFYVSLCDGALVSGYSTSRARSVHGYAANLWWGSTDHRTSIFWLVVRSSWRILTVLLFLCVYYCHHLPWFWVGPVCRKRKSPRHYFASGKRTGSLNRVQLSFDN